MFALPRVVAVDNDRQELVQIQDALVLARIPCLPILYDAATWESENLSKLCVAVRVVLLDLNLLEGAPNAETIAPYIAEVLSAVAPAGPYVLVFWSKHKDVVEEVLARLAERHKDIVAPFSWALLDKHEYAATGDEAKNQATGEKLAEKIGELLNAVPTLSMLSEWESRVVEGAARTVARLYSLASKQDPWKADTVQNKMADLLTWVARESVGRQIAKEIPGEAIDQGLHHALADELGRSAGKDAYNEAWRHALPMVGDRTFKPAADLLPAALNEVFHIDSVGMAVGERGTFSVLPAAFLAANQKVRGVFGTTVNGLKYEFLYLDGLEEAEKANVLDECTLGLVELSAACDYAQRKDRSLRCVLAALIPLAYSARTEFPDPEGVGKPRESKHEAIYRLPPMRVKDKDYVCKLNFRYILGLPKKHELFGQPLFRLRVPLLDEIAYRCSSHLARPGVISFH